MASIRSLAPVPLFSSPSVSVKSHDLSPSSKQTRTNQQGRRLILVPFV